jgi:hypothetical protein
MPSLPGTSSNVYWLAPRTTVRGHVVYLSDPVTRLMWIMWSNWLTVARTAKAIYRSCVGRSAIEARVEIVMQQDARSGALVGIYQDGRNVVDFVDGDDLMGR